MLEAEVDQLPVASDEELARVKAQLLPQQEMVDRESPLGIVNGLSHSFDRKAVIGPQCAEHVRFDQIPEREQWWSG